MCLFLPKTHKFGQPLAETILKGRSFHKHETNTCASTCASFVDVFGPRDLRQITRAWTTLADYPGARCRLAARRIAREEPA